MCKSRLSAILLLFLVEGITVVNAQEKIPVNKAPASSEYSQISIAPPPEGVRPPAPQGQVPLQLLDPASACNWVVVAASDRKQKMERPVLDQKRCRDEATRESPWRRSWSMGKPQLARRRKSCGRRSRRVLALQNRIWSSSGYPLRFDRWRATTLIDSRGEPRTDRASSLDSPAIFTVVSRGRNAAWYRGPCSLPCWCLFPVSRPFPRWHRFPMSF